MSQTTPPTLSWKRIAPDALKIVPTVVPPGVSSDSPAKRLPAELTAAMRATSASVICQEEPLESAAHVPHLVLERETPALGAGQHQVDPPDEVLDVQHQLFLDDQVAFVDLFEVAAVDSEDPVVVAVRGREALLEVAQDLVVELHLLSVERLLGLEAGPQQPILEADEKALESPRCGCFGRPQLVHTSRIGSCRGRVGRRGLFTRNGLRLPDRWRRGEPGGRVAGKEGLSTDLLLHGSQLPGNIPVLVHHLVASG